MKFDPCGFCIEMAGCNRPAGVTVFGQIFSSKKSNHANFISNNAVTDIDKN